MPGQKILGAFRHVRNHFEQHDGFVEVIEVIGGKPGAGIDVGGAQLRRAGLRVGARRWRCRAIGSRSVAAVEVICPTVSTWG